MGFTQNEFHRKKSKKKKTLSYENLYEIQILVIINQVILEHSQAHLFYIKNGCFSLQHESGIATETTWPATPKIFTV